MNRQAYTLIALLVLVGSMAVAAQAQNGRSEMRASIPFAFTVGNQQMPSGEYTVTQVNRSSDRAVLQLRSPDGRHTALVQMNDIVGKTAAGSRLTFNRYADECYFAEAWISGDSIGLQAPSSKAERAVRQQLASKAAHVETIALSRR